MLINFIKLYLSHPYIINVRLIIFFLKSMTKYNNSFDKKICLIIFAHDERESHELIHELA